MKNPFILVIMGMAIGMHEPEKMLALFNSAPIFFTIMGVFMALSILLDIAIMVRNLIRGGASECEKLEEEIE